MEPDSQAGALTLDTKLAGVLGGRTAKALERAFGYVTVGEFLEHFPRRYVLRGELTALDSLPLDENVTLVARVLETRERPMKARRGSISEVKISDGSGILSLTFFNQPWRLAELRPGVTGMFAGKVTAYQGVRQLAHPDYQLFEALVSDGGGAVAGDAAKEWAEQPVPVYPATSSLASWQIQKAMDIVLDGLGVIEDPVPAEVRSSRKLIGLREALEKIHRPTIVSDTRPARRALRFTEAFVLQTALVQRRFELRAFATPPRSAKPGGLLERFDAQLPFMLTADQDSVGSEIASDLAKSTPMSRLIQGEVGSGKTVLALRAMLAVADSGGQSALLAPTEVLAGQHLRSITKMLGPDLSAELIPTLITGQLSQADRKRALLRAAAGQSRIIVGTHALLGDTVSFADLGLIVVDEQHRFGVDQREALRLKGVTPPHVLVLTATPIPRTVAMTVFGDLDVSTVKELPSGRTPIVSHVVPLSAKPGWRDRIWERIAEEVELGRQAFIVCSSIDGVKSDGVDEAERDISTAKSGAANAAMTPTLLTPGSGFDGARASVASVAAEASAHPRLSALRIATLHGRMPSDEKDDVMRRFADGAIDVLIATTVIEVGVDVPNASMMIIMDADRFGISQLHQLRGRVGRGGVPGLCLLVTAAPPGSLGLQRVEVVAATLDGFALAEADIELRSEGDVLGTAQSGRGSSLKLLRVTRDADLIADARDAASDVVEADPTLKTHPALASTLRRRLDAETRDFLGKG